MYGSTASPPSPRLSPSSSIEALKPLQDPIDSLTEEERDALQAEQPGYGTRSRLEVAFNLVNATVGAGIIGLPFAILKAGFFTAIVVSVFVAILSQLGLHMLILAGQRTGIYKFAQLVEYLLGRPGYHFLNVVIFVQAGGACVSYFILIGDTIPMLLELYLPQYPSLHQRSLVVGIISAIFILPLNMPRSIGSLARWSILSVLCLPVILLTMLIRAPAYAPQHDAPLTVVGSDIFAALGIMAFAFACSQVAFSNYLSLRKQTSGAWAVSTTVASIMSYIASMTFAFTGYLCFGNDVQPNLFLNFDADDVAVNIGRFALGFSMMLTIPMAFFPTREAVQKTLGFETATRRPTKMEHYSVTVILFVFLMTIGITVRSLGKVYALVGGFAATTLAYILPAATYLATRQVSNSIDETAKTPLLHHETSSSSSSPILKPHHCPVKQGWWFDVAAGLLIVWGFVVMIFATSGVFTQP